MARVEIGGGRQGQELWASLRARARRPEFLTVAGLDPGTRVEDPHAFVELVESLLDEGSANTVPDVLPKPE